jgi:hypothetical protein
VTVVEYESSNSRSSAKSWDSCSACMATPSWM